VVRDRTAFTAPGSFSACGRCAFGIGRSRHARHCKMDMWRGSSTRSDVIASIMWLSSASRIFGICCACIKGITTRGELTYPYAKTRRSARRPPPRPYRGHAHSGRIAPSIWAGSIFRQAKGPRGANLFQRRPNSDPALQAHLSSCHAFREAVIADVLGTLWPDLVETVRQVAVYLDQSPRRDLNTLATDVPSRCRMACIPRSCADSPAPRESARM
jgi:hypothetical protein